MTTLTIATDGACSGNPGPGGWGYVAMHEEEEVSLRSGYHPDTTNNRMELKAAIEALKFCASDEIRLYPSVDKIFILTDSQYVQKGITEWITNWKKKNWIGSNKQPVKNRDLWEELDGLNQKVSVTWQWVRGHNGHPLNEIADRLANTECGLTSN